VVDTRKFSGVLHAARNVPWVFLQLMRHLPRARVVMLNGSRLGLIYIAPAVYLACAIFRAKFCLRPFGGDFADMCASAPWLHRWILDRTIFRADVLFLQTPALMAEHAQRVPRAVSFPTARPRPSSAPVRRTFARRFVFLSQITVEKGVHVLLDALDRLDSSYTVDFFGPIRNAKLGRRLEASGRYRGVVAPARVLDVLRDYDVLVLPTFSPEEGIPGAIIEAFSIGMPVISTRWRALPTIVGDGVSGVLVAPGSVDELASAIGSMDETAFARLSAGALHAFDAFDSERVNRAVLDVLLD
jgi:glycosyltransferase involved in cell wall biosynthesis